MALLQLLALRSIYRFQYYFLCREMVFIWLIVSFGLFITLGYYPHLFVSMAFSFSFSFFVGSIMEFSLYKRLSPFVKLNRVSGSIHMYGRISMRKAGELKGNLVPLIASFVREGIPLLAPKRKKSYWLTTNAFVLRQLLKLHSFRYIECKKKRPVLSKMLLHPAKSLFDSNFRKELLDPKSHYIVYISADDVRVFQELQLNVKLNHKFDQGIASRSM